MVEDADAQSTPHSTTRAIVRAAVQCFEARGYRSTSMADIAAQAGVSRRTVYHHFGSKDEVLQAAFEQSAGDFAVKVRRGVDSTLPFPQFVVECVMYIVEHAPGEPLFNLNINQELGMVSGSRYFSSELAIAEWVRVFQTGYIRGLRERTINPAVELVDVIEWVGRLSLSFTQHPRPVNNTPEDIRRSVDACFGNALRYDTN